MNRRVAFFLAGRSGTEAPLENAVGKRPFSVVFSVNRKKESTRRQIKRLQGAGLSPIVTPIPTASGTMDRVILGSFENYTGAKAFLKEKLRPILFKGEQPFIDRLPCALEVILLSPPSEPDVARVILKAAGFSLYMKEDGEEKRMLVGAFRTAKEARESIRILRAENIPFRVTSR